MRSVYGLSLSLFLACGACGVGDGTGASGVEGSKPVVSLTDGEKGQICDWAVGKIGAYGGGPPADCPATTPPGAATLFTYQDQADCIEDGADPDDGCQATVAELEACVNQLPRCATLDDVANAPACAAVTGC